MNINTSKLNFSFYCKRIIIFLIVYNIYCFLVVVIFPNKHAIAKTLSKFDSVQFAVIIISNPDNLERRKVVRNTWFNLLENIIGSKRKRYKWSVGVKQTHRNRDYIQFYFVIGTQDLDENVLIDLKREDSYHKDMLFLQEYKENTSLTNKVSLSIKAIHLKFPNLKYLVKCHDDTFVRIDRIIHEMENKQITKSSKVTEKYLTKQGAEHAQNGLYWGYLTGDRKALENKIQKEDNSFVCAEYFYVLYAIGGGYVISKPIVDYIGSNENWLSKFAPEDVSMGIWTSSLSIMRVHDTRFDSDEVSRPCDSFMVVRHSQNVSQMKSTYVNLIRSKGENICREIHNETTIEA